VFALAERNSPAREVLSRVFGFQDFRTGQSEAVQSLLAGRDTVVLLPTGAGKSLCYQVPAIVARRAGRGTTVVISPLISLMQDQVSALQGRGVNAAAINSHQEWAEQKEVGAEFLRGNLDLLYVSPERGVLDSFYRLLKRGRVAQLAIDEAHCLSQWGHDFRPEYMRLNELREKLEVPTIALTATATPRVMDEIVQHLALELPTIVRGDFSRPNLSFSVEHLRREAQRMDVLVNKLDAAGFRARNNSGRAIIYCSTRKKTQKIAKGLKAMGFAAGYYHAGRTKLARERAQTSFDTGRTRILVATNAFGMGVDYPDVRLIVHFQCPGSVEAYYQEAGRAGRDGLPSECLLFFGAGDMVTQRRLFSGSTTSAAVLKRNEEALARVESYASTMDCRQKFLCAHFTGRKDHQLCECCDLCTLDEVSQPLAKKEKALRMTLNDDERELIVQAVGNLTKPVGKTNLAKALRGSRAKSLHRGGLLKLPEHGALHHYSEDDLVHAIKELLSSGLLVKKGRKYPTVWLPDKAVRGTRSSVSDASAASKRPRKKTKNRRFSTTQLARALENYRRRKARSLKWKPYMVFQQRVILAVDDRRPESLDELQHIPGLGVAKIEKFGSDILEMVREFEFERH